MNNVLQIGFGPLGVQVAKYINDKLSVRTVGVVDVSSDLVGKSLNKIDPKLSKDVSIYSSVELAYDSMLTKPNVAIITTVSKLADLIPQIEAVAEYGIPIISTCEELSYP